MPRRTIMLLVSALVAGALSVTGAHAAVEVENGTITSFDGVPISYTLAHPDGTTVSPVVFMGHGWGGSRNTNFTSGMAKTLLDNGFAVLSWDARGFGTSGGEANVDSVDFEVKDVQALIDEVALRPNIQTDAEGDPRMGMVGASYGGGIQLATASVDHRVDAIVPEIAWNDLPQSLKPGGVLKLGWDLALYGLGVATGTALGMPGQTGSVAPQIHIALAEGVALNDWTTATHNWFSHKSVKNYINGNTAGNRTIPGIAAPTLVLQGVSDTLFPLNEGVANFNQVAANGVPTKLIAFCGGHTITPLGTSCSNAGTSAKLSSATVAWLNRYVKGDAGVDTGPRIEYQVQDGTFHSLSDMPAHNVEVDGRTQLTNTVAPTTGQGFAATAGGCRPAEPSERGGTGGVAPSRNYIIECPYAAGEWLEVAQYGDYINTPACKIPGETVPPGSHLPLCDRVNFHLPAGSRLFGIPRLDIEAKGIGTEAYAFFKLVDFDTVTKTKTVIDDQAMALKFTGLGGLTQSQHVSIDMAGIAWTVQKDHQIYLEITPTSNDHAVSRVPSTLILDVKLSIHASAVPAFSVAPASLSFGNVGITKTSAAKVATLTSTGTGPLSVSSVALSGAGAADYAVVEDCTGGSFDANEKCTASVTFTPATTGSKPATLTFTTDAGTSSVSLSGSGVLAAESTVSPLSLDFGDQQVGSPSAGQDVTVTNTGSATLNVTGITIAGANGADFSRVGCTGAALAPSASCTITVTFTPSAEGARVGTMTVASNAGSKVVTLAGNGTAA